MKATLLSILIVSAVTFVQSDIARCQGLPPVGTLSQELAACQADGIDMNPQDLEPRMPPDSLNAAPIYTQIGALVAQRQSITDELITDMGTNTVPATQAQIADLQSIVNGNADLLKLIHSAITLPQCIYAHDLSGGIVNLKFPEFEAIRRAVDWLEGESIAEAASGNGVYGVKDLSGGFAIAAQVQTDQPSAITSLVTLAIQNVTLSGLRKIMVITNGDPAVANEVQVVIENNYKEVDLKPALKFEIVCNSDLTFDQFCQFSKPGDDTPAQTLGNFGGAAEQNLGPEKYFNACRPFLISRMRTLYNICDSSKVELQTFQSLVEEESQTPGTYMYLENLLMPTYDNWPYKRLVVTAYARMTRLCSELLQYKAKNESFPSFLGQLGGPPPTDPMGSGYLGYKLKDSGFALYCGTDDGSGTVNTYSPTGISIHWPDPPNTAGTTGN